MSVEDLEKYLARCGERYSEEQHLLGCTYKSHGYHTRIPDGAWAHTIGGSLDYALVVLRTRDRRRIDRAIAILRKLLTLQDTDPTSRTYGLWPWLLEEPLHAMATPCWNEADFRGLRLAQILIDHADLLPDDLVPGIRQAVGHAAWSIFRRNMPPGYTNIAVMGAAATLAAGEVLGERRLLAYGRRRLHNLVQHTQAHGGFNEYNSPTYTIVAMHECERILQLVRDASARADADLLRRVGWRAVAEHYHPGTAQWAGPHSRAYSDRLRPSTARYLSRQTGVAIPLHPAVEDEEKFGAWLISQDHLDCPQELVWRFRALPQEPMQIRRRFILAQDQAASTWGTTWFSRDACLASVNHDTTWVQRRPVLGYWRTEDDPAVVLRLRFLRDGRDFASGYLRSVQHGPRVLSALGLASNKGDFHDHLDRPADGLFEARDFRLRVQLVGLGAAVRKLDDDRFELAAGRHRTLVYALPSHFGPDAVKWESGREDDLAYLDAICYTGRRRAFDPLEVGDVLVAVGMELLAPGKPPAPARPRVQAVSEGHVRLAWPIDDRLTLSVPLQAQPVHDFFARNLRLFL